jgi:hypothetical protein
MGQNERMATKSEWNTQSPVLLAALHEFFMKEWSALKGSLCSLKKPEHSLQLESEGSTTPSTKMAA